MTPHSGSTSRVRVRPAVLLALVALISALFVGLVSPAAVSAQPVALKAKALPTVALSSLPSQATDTVRLVQKGGPFPYRQDGTVFSNREGLLPQQSSGYYHEYTVKTPGSPDRGARRIITGGGSLTNPAHWYYTADHYASFSNVDITR
ncbi:ribonuclease domain-containing protein [Fodinicola acaciae]|uniref:ribonuclease domain-containing protein n=1 Tax=Fodinicola acaciae TaxID=2681555 RepID=UPI0013D4BCA9|nr:ribonuclease [Fodinicola acaciae]